MTQFVLIHERILKFVGLLKLLWFRFVLAGHQENRERKADTVNGKYELFNARQFRYQIYTYRFRTSF
jgi:hypothetical protein